MEFLLTFIKYVNYFALFYLIMVQSMYFLQLIRATNSLKKYKQKLKYSDFKRYMDSENMVPISIIVPAYNESATIVDNLKNLLTIDFPNYEIIMVNDGSTDETLQLVIEAYEMVLMEMPYKVSIPTNVVKAFYYSPQYPNLIVVDKENGGKADTLNVGINISKYPVFISMDADSLLEKEALIRITLPFLNNSQVVAVGGTIRVSSGCKIEDGVITKVDLPKTSLGRIQTVEYLRAFFTGRIGSDAMGMLLIISGAFGAFKKSAVIDAGGYTKDCIGEDMELVVKLHKIMRKKGIPYKIRFLEDPVCWTQPPENLRDLYKQRKRWQIGLINTLLNHKHMVFNPKYGSVGMFTIPYYWLFEFIGPAIETFGYIVVTISYLLGVTSIKFVLAFYLLTVFMGIILSIGAIMLENYTMRKFTEFRQLITLLLYTLIDSLGYRQFNTITRTIALIRYPLDKHSWGKMKRAAFEQPMENCVEIE